MWHVTKRCVWLSSRLFNLMNNRTSLTWDRAVSGTSLFSRSLSLSLLFLLSFSTLRSSFKRDLRNRDAPFSRYSPRFLVWLATEGLAYIEAVSCQCARSQKNEIFTSYSDKIALCNRRRSSFLYSGSTILLSLSSARTLSVDFTRDKSNESLEEQRSTFIVLNILFDCTGWLPRKVNMVESSYLAIYFLFFKT